MSHKYLVAFTDKEKEAAKLLLATQVVTMMGRKFEEGDWSVVYCGAKGLPEQDWSNLNIDVNFNGLGVEHKMKCERPKRSLLELCGTTLMHPSATRSIRIDSTEIPPDDAMVDVLTQYADLITNRTEAVKRESGNGVADMRTGWLIWERSLTEFMYFEEQMSIPDPDDFYAEWNERESRGARKGSKNLWIYEKATGKKRYSVTTKAGAKIQPYFDVPPPNSTALHYFKVQGEELATGHILMWISRSTARELERLLEGKLESGILSDVIVKSASYYEEHERDAALAGELAIPIEITKDAYQLLADTWGGISDEHRAQLLAETLRKIRPHFG